MSGFKNYMNIYEFDCILPGNGDTIKFKPLTTQNMKKLLVYEKEDDIKKISSALNELISSCVVSENFNINDLFLLDRLFLLMEIRKKTKGESYSFQLNCPECKSQTLQIIDLNKLKIIPKNNDMDNIIKISDDISIEIDHIKISDEKEALKRIKKNLTDNEKSLEYQLNLIASCIKSVIHPGGKDENISFEDKIFIIDNSTNDLLEKINQWQEDNKFGIDLKIEHKCNHCDFKDQIEVPMNYLFM